MNYAYYPGCSLTESAMEYDVSTRAVMAALEARLTEIPDWTCCGAAAVEAVNLLLSYALPARNLALAARDLPGQDILVPCSACYLNHLRVARACAGDKRLRDELAEVVDTPELHFGGEGRVRHLLDVLANDLGARRVAERTTRPLSGLTVAAYYGCQAVRPYAAFDDPERPASMDALIAAVGAKSLDWDLGATCCGASLMATKQEVALHSVARILAAAQAADVVVTVCPLCQMNLEAYRRRAMPRSSVSILYLPQLLGLAFGLPEGEVMLGKNMAVETAFMNRFGSGQALVEAAEVVEAG